MKDDDKCGVLLALLEERYRVLHEIRRRVETALLTALTSFAAISFWLAQLSTKLSPDSKWALSLLVSLVCVATFAFMWDQRKGFINNQRALVDVEEALDCYTNGAYLPGRPLFPEKWKNAGKPGGDGHFMKLNFILLAGGAAVALLMTWWVG